MKNILLVQPCHYGFGGYNRSNSIAEVLADDNCSITHIYSSEKFNLKKKKQNKINIIELPRVDFGHFITGRLLRAFIIIAYIIKNHKRYDIIHFFNIVQLECLLPAYILFPVIYKKTIIDWDDYWSLADESVPLYKKLRFVIWYLRIVESISANLFKRYTTTSEYLSAKIKNKKLIILNLGINNKNNEYHEYKNKNPIFLMLGNTFFNKRSTLLYEFMEMILVKYPESKVLTNVNVELIWGEIMQRKRSKTLNLSVKESILSIGYVDKDKLKKIIPQVTAMIMFMGENGQELACSPTRVSSLRDSSLPVITNRTKNITHQLLELNGVAISGSDMDEVLKSFCKFYENKITWENFRKNVFINWEFFPTMGNYKKEILNFYDN